MDQLVSAFFGPLAVWVVQRLKRALGLEGTGALWLAFVVSVFFALLAEVVSGGLVFPSFADPVEAVRKLGEDAAIVFSVATIIYRHIQEG